MPDGKVVSLKATPSKSAILCFDAEGIIAQSDVRLGQSVSGFDFPSFYAELGSTVADSPARLVYDSQAISTDKAVLTSALMTLRAEPRKALLDKAIAARENAYYQKYADQAAVIALQRQYYDPANPDSKPARLATLSTVAQEQADALINAYVDDERTGVIKATTSGLNSLTNSVGSSITQSSSQADTTSSGQNLQDNSMAGEIIRYTNSSSQTAGYDPSETLTRSGTRTWGGGTDSTNTPSVTTYLTGGTHQSGSGAAGVASNGQVTLSQTIVNTDYGYRVPSAEAIAQNHRAQISLMDEQFAQFMLGQDLPYLEKVFANELAAIDLDVKRLQVAYLDTILLSPINGVVTSIFKQPGEGVRAGEGVIRVEDNTNVLVVGTIIQRELVPLGATATITYAPFSEPLAAPPLPITGTIVAAQGHTSEDDWWDVVVSCDNVDGNGEPILPLYYHFDFDNTSILIS
jgi:hypothetical protein